MRWTKAATGLGATNIGASFGINDVCGNTDYGVLSGKSAPVAKETLCEHPLCRCLATVREANRVVCHVHTKEKLIQRAKKEVDKRRARVSMAWSEFKVAKSALERALQYCNDLTADEEEAAS